MQKLRHLFMSSFRWRLLINISLSYLITFLVYSALLIILQSFNIFNLPDEGKYAISFSLSFVVFLVIFLDLMNITLRYINDLNETIQKVTIGDYDAQCEIEYDDELGMLAANINALAKTLKEKEHESAILKENERLAYDAERNAEKQKNDLITNVAHDLRTPLTTIVGYLELIKSNEHITLEDVHKYADIAYDKSLRLQAMMDDLFEFTKLDNTGIKMNLNVINISELLLQMSDEFYPSFQDHRLTPIINIKNPSLFVIGDGQLLARVFENLISNALKYGFDDTEIKIEVLSDEENVTVKIMNHGATISQDDLPYLFDKFYRTDESRGTSQGGTGLGLAIAKSIVEMHKGQILVTSHEGITTFVVILKRHITEPIKKEA